MKIIRLAKRGLVPYWSTDNVRLYHGDVTEVLRRLPAKSVQTVVTSPPYWGLRDYGTDKSLEIGSEPTIEEYVVRMVEVFAAVWRVLRDDGTVWLNLGDTYGGGFVGRNDVERKYPGSVGKGLETKRGLETRKGLGSGNLCGIPWRIALALQEDGWILRQDIIWSKPSPMPESVRNRCTKSHEYLFLLTKVGSGYYCDMEAIKESSIDSESYKGRNKRTTCTPAESNPEYTGLFRTRAGLLKLDGQIYPSRNKRSVWWIASESYEGAHFATFPRKLVELCILAGTSAKGCCVKCGAPWGRITSREQLKRDRPRDYVKRTGEEGTGSSCANSVAGVDVTTLGWEPTCNCNCGGGVKPCTVLDPFVGSGTTCCVAVQHGRHSIGIDLSEEYLRDQAVKRIKDTMDEMEFARIRPRPKRN